MTDLREALRREAEREVARRDLLSYLAYIDPKYEVAPHIVYLASLLTAVANGEIEKACLSIMPRAGKSRLLAHWAAWMLGRTQDESLLLLSASQSLATRNSRWIRQDVLSERYPWEVGIAQDSSSILSWRTTTGSEVKVFSTESILTGQAASRGLGIIADDCQPSMMTPLTRDSLETWLRSVLETRREPGAPLVILNSRWSTDDLISRLASSEDSESWQFINIEAICEDPEADPLHRALGESVWPSKWPTALLEKKKRAVGPVIWDASYQGKPVPEGGRLVNPALFVDYVVLPQPPPPVWNEDSIVALVYKSPLDAAKPTTDDMFLTIAGVDCSGVALSTTSGSYSAMVICMLDTRTNDIFIRDVSRIRNCTFEQLRSHVLNNLAMYNPNLTLIEHAAQGGRLAGDLQRSSRYPIQLIEPRQSKEDRIINVLLPMLDAGKLHIPKGASWRRDFLTELADAPFGKYTDQCDALCLAVGYARMAVTRRLDDDFFNRQMEGFSLFR